MIQIIKKFRFGIILNIVLFIMVIIYSFASDQVEFIIIFAPVTIISILLITIVNGSRKQSNNNR